MIGFLISFILIFSSSWFLSSVLSKVGTAKGFLYLFLIAFCQIILISEILSCFNLIKQSSFLFFNVLIFLISLCIWYKAGKPSFIPKFNDFTNKFKNSLRLDKSLTVLFLGWLFFIIISLILIVILPSTSADAYCYHVLRSFDWVINGSMNHYEAQDIRSLTFPINSEILYMWIILFTKKQLCLGIFSFLGFIGAIVSGFQIFKFIGFSFRRTLWTYFIVSSFASVIVMISGTETDLLVAGLITTSIYLFIDGLKNKNNSSLYMSSLSYALAIGVKTPAILCMPAVGLFYLILSYKYRDKFAISKILMFGLLNFMIFSSYNYILNFIDYGNFMGEAGAVISHKNIWGVRGFVSSFIKHLFLLVDFSGFVISDRVGNWLLNFENSVLTFFNLESVPNGLYSGKFFFNYSLLEPGMGCGVLTVLLIWPCWIKTVLTPFFKKRRISDYQAVFAYMLLINIIVLSVLIAFMTFNTRFLTCFIIISAPMLACSYIKSNKNILKWIYIIIALIYFTVISTHLWGRPFFRLIDSMSKTGIKQLRSDVICGKYDKRMPGMNEWCNINGLIESKFNNKNYKVLYLPNFAEEILFTKSKKLQGYDYTFLNIEHLKNINPDDFDIIVYPIIGQWVTVFDKYTPDSIDYYFNIDKINHVIDYYPLDLNSETMCYYNGLKDTLSKQLGNENLTPVKKVCLLTTNFFNKHPFEIAYKTNKYYILLNKNIFK